MILLLATLSPWPLTLFQNSQNEQKWHCAGQFFRVGLRRFIKEYMKFCMLSNSAVILIAMK
jgi:hypothetical protein